MSEPNVLLCNKCASDSALPSTGLCPRCTSLERNEIDGSIIRVGDAVESTAVNNPEDVDLEKRK